METQSLIPSENIKQEPDYEAARDFENTFPSPSVGIKCEQDFEEQTEKKEANQEEENSMSPDIKRTWTNSTSFSDEDSCLYCEKCQMKYEGECPQHGPLIYVDNAEGGQGEGYSQDSSPYVQVDDNNRRQATGGGMMEQCAVNEAFSIQVVRLQNGDCITESTQIVSVCEMNTKLFGADSICELQKNAEINTDEKIHSTGKPFTCDVCGSGFAYFSHLNRHKRIHTGEKPYKCDLCGVGFTESGNLTSHKRTHTGEKPYKCDVCGTGYIRSGDVRRHMRTHTGEKPYKCDVCGVGFVESGSLKRHKRRHTGEKSYKCDVCAVGFAESGALIAHKRTHTGEKPFKCDVCLVGFSVNGALKRHKRIHTREKPYKCDLCGVGFAVSTHLKAHEKTHYKVHNRINAREKKPHKYDVFGVELNQGELNNICK